MSFEQPIPIAIIGMGCRYPAGANSPEALWNVVAEGRSGWTEVPPDRFNHEAFYHPDPEAPGAINQKGGHFIDQNIADFDAGFFDIAPKEAEALDPQQRVMLETSWEAVENAGIPMERFRGSDTGIFVAMFGHDFDQILQKDPIALSKHHNLGASRPLLANRVSYSFDLVGPSVVIDTACSGSLVAVNLACQSLRLGETSMALAGGVGLIFSPDQMALMSMTGIFNDQGRSFAFDDRGNGYGRGEGVGMIALKRLDDALRDGDNVRAIIRSSGVNSDGRTNGVMLPSQKAQERLARSLFRGLPFSPADVHYVEAHGTGTKAGDEVEIKTIDNVFCKGRDSRDPVFVGATKPNIGHSEAASGVAGLIKTVMAMEKGLIPPNILLEHFKPGLEPNERSMSFARSLTPWPSAASSRKAAVNSFGFGGTNAMVILESADTGHSGEKEHDISAIRLHDGNNNSNRNDNHIEKNVIKVPRLFTLSARSEHSLQHAVKELGSYLDRQPRVNLNDLSHTLTACRSKFHWRSSLLADDVDSLVSKVTMGGLASYQVPDQAPVVVFVFTGQGAQSAMMGCHLLAAEENDFKRSICRSEELLKDLGAQWSLTEELSRDQASSRLNDSKYAQPASTAVQLALVDLLTSWGIRPVAVTGHSSGEIAAAYAAGALSQRTALSISYHRSFLAEMSKQRTTQFGAMMAVGLGQDDVERYIKRLQLTGATVACINSPSSTTISGDASAVMELKNALDADGVFTRQLKVDTAYHSHHMKLVGPHYLRQLEGLEADPVHKSIRFFSTVTGKEKNDGFGASYWVDNLLSPVRFSDSVQELCQAFCRSSLNFIEIGPHKTLSGPIQQTLASLQADLSYKYIPTLVRGEDAVRSLLSTGSSLFQTGSNVDTRAVASLSISRPSLPTALRDLPSYCWDHTTTYWAESRLSREHRCREHAPHDLLGTRLLSSPDSRPSWRILLSTETLPWLGDHIIDGFIVFPAAAYMTMAIQALQQLDRDRRPDLKHKAYSLKNVTFKKILTLPADGKPIETTMTLQYLDSSDSWAFAVSSISDQNKWQDHCDGTISAALRMDSDDIELENEADFGRESQIARLERAREKCTTIIPRKDLYAKMAAIGNQYGPSFAINDEARISALQSFNSLFIADAASKMPSMIMQPHVIHPTTLDAIIQTLIPVFQQHSIQGSIMPVFIGGIFISADISNLPGTQLQVVCDLSDVSARSASFSTTVSQINEKGEPACVLTIDQGGVLIVGESKASQQWFDNDIFKLEWGLDSSSITAELLESAVAPLQSDEVGISQAEKFDLSSLACAKYIGLAVAEVHERGLRVEDDYRANWWRVLESFVNSTTGKALIQRSPEAKDELDQLTMKLGVEGEAIARIGPELVSLLTGQTDPLTHFLKDDLLYRVYHSDEFARPNRYMADYAKIRTFQRRDLKILEIGAGTGGTTLQVLQACSPNGEKFCSEYLYTDISTGFFEAVKTTTLKKWAHLLKFQTFDLEREASEQGIEEHSYDLVIAANVVHATRNLTKSLSTIHKLLKPGGMLALMETIRTTPWINLTFGSIPGWWAGVGEGRTESPLQSTEQWNEHLKMSGFSGVELAAYDLPEPERRYVMLLSTALAADWPMANVYDGSRRVEIFDSIPEGHPAQELASQLASDLAEKGFQPSLAQWTDTSVDDSCSYIILDMAQRPLLTSASDITFARVTSLLSKASKLYWISLSGGSDGIEADNALVTGLARTARAEKPHLDCFTINVQDSFAIHSVRIRHAITDFINSTEMKISRQQPREFDLMYRNSSMHIQRLVPDDKLTRSVSTVSEDADTVKTTFHQTDRPLKLRVGKPGVLSSLLFVDDDQGDIGPDEVEIKPYAWGVNSSDVLIALGQLPPTHQMVGESAGIVTAIGSNFASRYKAGDRVAALSGIPYASRTRTSGHFIHHIPYNLSFTAAASIPFIFATAYYSLFDCANLKQGQSLLIHSASGALGQAAMKIAQLLNVTVFATVESTSQRQLLMELYGMQESHIFSSRTTSFAAGVKRLTNGEGVDVVLNSLSGPMIHASWECVAAFGTFVQVGNASISRRSQLNMELPERNLKFASVDLAGLLRRRPEQCQSLLRRIFADLEAGLIAPVSVTTLSIGNIEEALRLMQRQSHSGKIVLEATDESSVQAKARPLRLRADGTYIIVGGLGGLGRHYCRHLQAKGARYIALLSRQKLDASVRHDLEMQLTDDAEAVVKIITCDVGDERMVSQVVDELRNSMPVVRGILHSGMVLSDRTLSRIKREDFEIALRPKYRGTVNLYEAFYGANLDFFIMLSSLCGLVGSLGQSNYAAGGTFQDMFPHAQLSMGQKRLVTVDLPLIKSTYPVAPEYIRILGNQGLKMLPIEATLLVIDYAMSGNAFKDGNHQIAFGLDPQVFLDQVKQGGKAPPLMSHVVSHREQGLHGGLKREKERSAEEKIALASTMEDAEQLVLTAIRNKVSSLTVLNARELDLDQPVANMALDSLVATEIKNWITNRLQAPVKLSDIMDAPNLRHLASLITQTSGLLKDKLTLTREKTTDRGAPPQVSKEISLPNWSLPSLETSLEVFLDMVGHMGDEQVMKQTSKAIKALLQPNGLGQRLQARLAALTEEQGEIGRIFDMYIRNKWLRGRDWRPRVRNFFGTLPFHDTIGLPQAEQAARLSLAAYGYKLAVDAGFIEQDYHNGQALDMSSVYWLFGSSRMPALGCDRYDRFPGSDHMVVMKYGHAYKVSLRDRDNGQVLSHGRLRSILEAILRETPEETNWASILTTADRDEWARMRKELMASQSGHDFITAIDESLFILCLEEAAPETEEERVDIFLLDDNSNRWLDKTLSLIVCANGVSGLLAEHSMIDGTSLRGLIEALTAPGAAKVTSNEATTPVTAQDYTYLRMTTAPVPPEYIAGLRERHQSSQDGYGLASLTEASLAAVYLREHKLPPKSVVQIIIQMAIRRLLGYNPLGAVDVVSQRSLRGGRTDVVYVMTPPMQAFCAAAEDASVGDGEKRELLLEAVRSHARLVAMSARGRGFRTHLMALQEMLEPGEEMPELFRDELYRRASEAPVCTSFTEFGLPEMGSFPQHKGHVWIGVQVLDDRVDYSVVQGEGRSGELVEHLRGATEVMQRIITNIGGQHGAIGVNVAG